MKNLLCSLSLIAFIVVSNNVSVTSAQDWPMWRYDSGRTGAAPHELPRNLKAQWSKTFSPRVPVWDDPLNRDLMPYDSQFEPIVVGQTMLLNFNDTDKLLALDLETGEEKWRFYANGPVRFPATTAAGKAYLVSDDGYLYCLDIETGKEVWKFRGGPSDRKILGNRRLISTWPARGAAVVDDGTVYFAASIWPFMGTFIYALNAETGAVEWMNDNTSAIFIDQPHHYPAFAGVAPQGYLAVTKEHVLVPGGRSIPACLNRATGELEFFHLADYGKSGGSSVFANEHCFWGHERDSEYSWFNLSDGRRKAGARGKQPVLTDDAIYFSGDKIEKRNYEEPDEKIWSVETDATGDLILAGQKFYAGGKNEISVWKLDDDPKKAPTKEQTIPVEGTVARLVAGGNKLIAVTEAGKIIVHAENAETPKSSELTQPTLAEKEVSEEIKQQAAEILKNVGTDQGYAFFIGIGDGKLLQEIHDQSDMVWVVLDNDEAKIKTWREVFDRHTQSRISFLPGDLENYSLPVYLSNLSILNDATAVGYETAATTELARSLYEGLRPYGGTLWITQQADQEELEKRLNVNIDNKQLSKASLSRVEKDLVLKREGQLEGAGTWTHQYGNLSNTVKSDDSLVKLPMGLLWFGGSSNMDVLPRHGHGPPEQVIGGRLFIEGMDVLSARDVYSGRILWQTKLSETGSEGTFWDHTYKDTPLSIQYNQVHIPGANARGTNFIATEDRVYIIQKDFCRVLDAATGQDLDPIRLPANGEGKAPEDWGFIGVHENFLIGGADFAKFSSRLNIPIDRTDLRRSKFRFIDYDKSASLGLVIMDRHTGEEKWQLPAKHSFIHNAICVGRELLYVLDKLPPNIEQQMKRRGKVNPDDYSLTAYNIETGEPVWQTSENIFGTWLGYSPEHRILIQSTRPSNDTVKDENGRQIIAYDAETGEVLWNENISYSTPPILHGDKLITGGRFYSLLTGQPLMRTDPITGQKDVWSFTATKGCNYPIGSEKMLTFRSSSAAFYDLTNDGGTGHFGGFKSGCTSNLVAAEGLLNAPDYTRTCTCSFQNQTSLAMVHMPDLEIWTHNDMAYEGDRIRSVGINFGAPGDRRDADQTMWLEYPEIGGPSPSIKVLPKEEQDFFVDHSSRYKGTELKWVASSGLKGKGQIDIVVKPTALDSYEVGFTCLSPHDDAAELEEGRMNITDPRFYPASKLNHTAGIRFGGLPIPTGATVKSAYIQFRAAKSNDVDTNVDIWGEATGNAARYATKAGDLLARKRTETKVNWEIPEWKANKSREAERTPDLAPIIQEIINREDWKPGNAINFLIHGTGERIADASEGNKKGDKSGIPRLFLELDEASYQKMVEANQVEEQNYTVRLIFAEPEEKTQAGQRKFNVKLQGEPVLTDFDILESTQSPLTTVIKSFSGVPVGSRLNIELEQLSELPAVLNGVELKLEE